MKLSKPRFNEIYREYEKHLSVLEKINGWKGWNGFSTPRSGYGISSLHKVTFTICKTKAKPDLEKANAALKAELERRLIENSQPFCDGVIRYFRSKNQDVIDGCMDRIRELVEANSKPLSDMLQWHLDEAVWVNELFQRVKDFETYYADTQDLEQMCADLRRAKRY